MEVGVRGGGLGGTQNTGSEATGPGTSDMPLGCLLPAPPCLSLCVHPPCPVRSLFHLRGLLEERKEVDPCWGCPCHLPVPPQPVHEGLRHHPSLQAFVRRPPSPSLPWGPAPKSWGTPEDSCLLRVCLETGGVWTRRPRTPGFLSLQRGRDPVSGRGCPLAAAFAGEQAGAHALSCREGGRCEPPCRWTRGGGSRGAACPSALQGDPPPGPDAPSSAWAPLRSWPRGS